jgi:hypothetical protein
MNNKAQYGKLGVILILVCFGLIWFGGLGSGLSAMTCTNAQAGTSDGLWQWFLCNFFGVGVAIFLMVAFLAVVFV